MWLTVGYFVSAANDAFAKGKLLIRVVDAQTQAELPFRIHLRNQAKVPVRLSPQLPFWIDHTSVPGALQLELLRGNYFFEIEHGPEYVNTTGFFTLNDGADDDKVVELKRACSMSGADWWSGDLDVRRPLRDLELSMAADDLNVVPLVTWTHRQTAWAKEKPPVPAVTTFGANTFCDALGGADDRDGGPIRIFRLPQPLPVDPASTAPIAARVAELSDLATQHPSLHIDVDAAAWDLPILVATGRVDSVNLLNSQLRRDRVVPNPAVRPFDKKLYLPTTGPAEYAEQIYFQLLNCGLKIAPSAGSGSGTGAVLGGNPGPTAIANPIGYNRVYVQVPRVAMNYDAWWEGLKSGRTVVTNGPLMRPKANGAPPGYVFAAQSGSAVTLELSMELTTRDKISYVEVIRDGRVAQSLPIRDWAADGGRFAPLKFEQSGWCLIRARCDIANNYRVAMSAPWYVEIDVKPRVSRTSAQFFLDWVEERAKKLAELKTADAAAIEAAVVAARTYWKGLVDSADAP